MNKNKFVIFIFEILKNWSLVAATVSFVKFARYWPMSIMISKFHYLFCNLRMF